ncbi:MAG: PorP/SprF family type IX secretion system membrane protein [Saprospiraceae bacterium]|jgi:type IX secretion system PorP/SprF family membrane protein|nr:PorP/SprF family type IX secretion system membrane protein [Saprospiraceae bacterium]MBK7794901.1 PorP/SprF family type IX secretion system membrane protein [Saprospiraceae bacterium]MBK8153364.1 PorP/SprF family type IX secretion system membrane protein [Saprospiraceae bacterium]MBL0261266.1 PorP/SprF family type IX secretion system membrane protein [Saprospiraceae bacterium]
MFKNIICCTFIVLGFALKAQDLHYSQFYHHPQSQNPAFLGFFDGDHRVYVNGRQQWRTVPVNYLTASLLFDSKFFVKHSSSYIGWGIGIDYDQAGDSKLNLAKLSGGINYMYSIGTKHQFGLGIMPSISQRRFQDEKLRWDLQWDGERYDPTLSPQESFENVGSFYFDLGAGALYSYKYKTRTRIHLGAGFYHLNKPDQAFYGSNTIDSKLPIRQAYQAAVQLPVFPILDIIFHGQHQTQEKYEETNLSALLRLYVNRKPGSLFNILVGCGLRMEDAYYPTLAIEYNNWMVSGSYDFNQSSFKTATDQRGGSEIVVRYIFKSVKPLGFYKKCPIY